MKAHVGLNHGRFAIFFKFIKMVAKQNLKAVYFMNYLKIIHFLLQMIQLYIINDSLGPAFSNVNLF